MQDSIEIPICLCGLHMHPYINSQDSFYCGNCDRVQEQELQSEPRNVTLQDARFKERTFNQIREWYT